MPLPLQGKLLRVLQDKEFEPLGSNRIVRADVRIIAATSADLPALVAAGRFRADLFYRLNVLTIHAPPLRERTSDIEALAYAMLEDLSTQARGGSHYELQDDALRLLCSYAWPGNVRELRNTLERAGDAVGQRADRRARACAVHRFGTERRARRDGADAGRLITDGCERRGCGARAIVMERRDGGVRKALPERCVARERRARDRDRCANRHGARDAVQEDRGTRHPGLSGAGLHPVTQRHGCVAQSRDRKTRRDRGFI